MNQTDLEYKPVDFDQHADICRQFREDTEICSYGTPRPEDSDSQAFLERQRIRQIETPGCCVHVWMDGQIIGQLNFSRFLLDESIGYLNWFYLAPEFRGTGIATEMDNYATMYFKERGFSAARLSVTAFNKRALRFYQKHGWADMGPLEDKPDVHSMLKRFGQA